MSDQEKTTLTLPSGRTVSLAIRRGRHLERAFTAVGNKGSNPAAMAMALFAQVAEVDGKPVSYEEVAEEYDYADVLAIIGWVNDAQAGEAGGAKAPL